MNTKILSALIIIAIVFVSGCAVGTKPPTSTGSKVELSSLKKFSSLEEVKSFIGNNTVSRGYGFGTQDFVSKATVPTVAGTAVEDSSRIATPDYSKTNIQVEGVDEADIVKTDGKYIYTVSGNKVVVVEAYPAENGKVLSSVEVNGRVYNMFINKDRLIVFGNENVNREDPDPYDDYYGSRYMPTKPFVKVYDITDKTNPVLKRDLALNGTYFDSRMIGNWVYFVVNNNVWGRDIVLPLDDGEDIYYFDEPANSYMFTLVGALNLEDDSSEPQTKTFLFANTEQMFVSLDNIYITHQFYPSQENIFDDLVKEVLLPLLPSDVSVKINQIYNSDTSFYEKQREIGEVLQEFLGPTLISAGVEIDDNTKSKIELVKKIQERASELLKKWEKSVVYKISISHGVIKAVAKGEFPGTTLNQFSMDEFNGYFRTATTTGEVWEKTSKNHVYVLGDDGSGKLEVVGKLEDLAPGEKIYSVRFLGERGYVVTFKKVDPLFVIDLKYPTNPKVLGKLKIPGYSDYLHPYDQNHIIGIGKNTIEASEELKGQRDLDFAWYQGVKLALFDVTDPENLKEASKFVIGDRGTESLALQDHKAFLFSKEKNLLVIPVLLAEIKDKTVEPLDKFGPQYGDYTFQGAYVFELTLDKGFVLKGRITHVADSESFKKSGYYYFGSGDAVQRSLYIGDVLYTISDSFVKANDLADLSEINALDLENKNNVEPTTQPTPSATPYTSVTSSPTTQPTINVTPIIENNTNSTEPIHWHVKLTIKINGTVQEIPQNIGVVEGGETNPVHTHDEPGLIHMEIGEPTEENVKLGYFFKVWGKQFDGQCIFESCNTDDKKVKMFVNGEENAEFESYKMKDKDEISIEYGDK